MSDPDLTPTDPRNPGDAFLQNEIDENRASERVLVPKALIAFAFVALLVIVREVFFV
jgi:hypothetical protein